MRFRTVALLCLLAEATTVAGVNSFRRRKPPPREQKAYDTSVRAFSPDGSIYQVEYAGRAVDQGSLAIGIQTEEGVILAAHTREHSPLLKASSISKINDIDKHTCCAMSGLLPDGRLMVDHARSWAQEHWFEFEEPPSVEGVASQLSRIALRFNGYEKTGDGGGEDEVDKNLAMSRPVGVALLLAGVDHRGPVLYHLDPSGAYLQWRARAIGEHGEDAEAKLEQAEYEGMSLREAMALVLRVFEAVLKDGFSTDRLEMACLECRSGHDWSGAVGEGGDGGEGDGELSTRSGGRGGRGQGQGSGAADDGVAYRPSGQSPWQWRVFRRLPKKEMDALVKEARKLVEQGGVDKGEGDHGKGDVPDDE